VYHYNIMIGSSPQCMVLHLYKKRQSVMSALKMLRSKLIATMMLTLLSGGTAAVAQNQGAGACGLACWLHPGWAFQPWFRARFSL
jgi:hypothetical protein